MKYCIKDSGYELKFLRIVSSQIENINFGLYALIGSQ